MPQYTLIYFNGRGRAEACRLLFALAGVKYEDRRIGGGMGEEWQKVKPTTKFGQLPQMDIDGKQFAQSRALLTYLAKEFGYYSSNNLEALAIEEVLSIVEDFFQATSKMMFAPEEKKDEIAKDYKENQVPKFLSWFEKLLKQNGSGYFVGEKVTVADVACYDFVSGCEKRFPGCLDKFPAVKALVDKIGNLDGIKAWVATRPDTPF